MSVLSSLTIHCKLSALFFFYPALHVTQQNIYCVSDTLGKFGKDNPSSFVEIFPFHFHWRCVPRDDEKERRATPGAHLYVEAELLEPLEQGFFIARYKGLQVSVDG